MKKTVFLIAFLMAATTSFAQFSAPRLHYYKEISVDSVSGTDSVYVYEDDGKRTPFRIKSGHIGVIAEYYSLDDNDATLDIGVSNGHSFNTLDADTTKLPLLLDLQNDSTDVNGVLKGNTAGVTATKMWKSGHPVPFENMAFKLILNSASSGTIKLWIYGYE